MSGTLQQAKSSADRGRAIVCRNVCKTYKLYGGPRAMAMDQLGLHRLQFWREAPKFQEFKALNDVSFEILHGERYGIVGRNGAGKTTLLRLITQNYLPTTGTLEVDGTVQALMQTGLGFNPEFSGAENIRSSLYYNGLIGKAYKDAFADVVEFVELGHFLHQPFKTYSLGMQARLQFAAATAVKTDILIIDEVMGAGDGYFATKSAMRMRNLTESGCTLLLVSHSMHQVLQFCDKAIWMHEGGIRKIGPVGEIVQAYEEHFEEAVITPGYNEKTNPSGSKKHGKASTAKLKGNGDALTDQKLTADQELTEKRHDRALERLFLMPKTFDKPFIVETIRACEPIDTKTEVPRSTLLHGRFKVEHWPGSGEIEITSPVALTQSGEPAHHIHTGEHMTFSMMLDVRKTGDYALIYTIFLYGVDGSLLACLNSPIDRFSAREKNKRQVEVRLGSVPFGARDYAVSFGVFHAGKTVPFQPNADNRIDLLSRFMCLRVPLANENDTPIIHWPATWQYNHDSILHESRISAIQ